MMLTGTLHAAAICMHSRILEKLPKKMNILPITQDSYSKLSNIIVLFCINLLHVKASLINCIDFLKSGPLLEILSVEISKLNT